MRTHTVIPNLPTGYPLSPCKGMWSVIVPAAATNLITNPSMELDTTGYSVFGASASRSTADQRRGAYSLRVTPSIDTSIVSYAVTLAPDTTYTWSVDVKGAPGVAYSLRVYDTGAVDYLPWRTEFRGTGHWERIRLSFVSSANNLFGLFVQQDGGDVTPVYSVDGYQLTALPYDTTYLDGDQPGCSWTGLRHASVSSRSAQSRAGGRITSFDDLGFTVLSETGLGMQPAEDITTPTGLLGGALYQRTVPRTRSFVLMGELAGTTFAQLERQRAELHAALSAFSLAEQQPIILRYQAIEGSLPIGAELELPCFYTGGLEGTVDNLYGERVAVQFTMYQPLILSVGESGATLGTTQSITDADYIVERLAGGAWHALGGGVDDFVNVVLYGPDGNLYAAGNFATAYNAAGTGSPVTVNHIARWDGSSWSALGSGLNNDVYALAFDAAGNLYAGGAFTDAAYPYLAKWNGVDWDPVDDAADATGNVYALTVDHAGRLYVGGDFDDWAAIADADNIVRWDGVDWEACNTGANDGVYALTVRPNGWVVAGGNFTTIGGTSANRVAQFNPEGGSWHVLDTGFNGTVRALAIDASGAIVAGGGFTDAPYPYIARQFVEWGTTFYWAAVGSGVNYLVWALARDWATNNLIVGGVFTEAGGRTLADRVAQWTGTEWLPLDIDLPGTTTVQAIAAHTDGRLALGYQDAGTATSSTTSADIVNAGSAPAAPIITARGPGRIESLVNWTSRKALYLDLELQDGETLTIDLTPGAISVSSDFRGSLGSAILSGSDLTSWRLLPGANTIVVKSDTAVLMRWRTAYTSLAGAVR